jgi:multiple sugar transport system permease protein
MSLLATPNPAVRVRERPPRDPVYDLSRAAQIGAYLILGVGAFIMVLPFLWMFSTACKPPPELAQVPIRFIPIQPQCTANFAELTETSPLFGRYLVNTALLTIGRTLGQLVTCSLAAYGFARFRFPGRGVLFALSLGLLVVPIQAIIVQEFILISNLGLRNTFGGLIIPGIFSAFALFLLRQAFLQIPLEIEESARLDGANPLQVLWYVTLPLSRPALIAFAVITVQAAWNDFLFPLVIANTPETRVITIGISLLQGERSTPWNLLMMGSLVATVPMLALFVVLQRYFIEGVSMSGLKR